MLGWHPGRGLGSGAGEADIEAIEGSEGEQVPRELVEDGLKHIRDEVLELLYRRDIEDLFAERGITVSYEAFLL